jgi:NADH dehydrogenase
MDMPAASDPSPTPRRPRVVIVGGGFGGLNAAKGLRRAPVDVLLIDKHNYHLFQPLLYQVATAALSPADIAYPIRRVFRNARNVSVVMGEVDRIDPLHKVVCGGDSCISFDYLIVAVGATHSYFGNDHWHAIAPGLKTIDDATEIRRRVLLAFEEAEHEKDEESRRADLTFVVVGGGPTGVELAGALREIAAQDIARDFHAIDTTTTRIILVQGGDRLLPAFPEELGRRAEEDLRAMGVEVRLNARVTKVDPGGVYIGDEFLPAQNVLWAAGVQASPMLKTMNAETDRSGRVIVQPDLSLPGYPNVFVIGDAAAVKDPDTGEPVPGVAQAAIQMGKFVAEVIRDEVAGSTAPRPAFKYRDKGTMATIGKRRAVALIGGWKLKGFIAWLIWSVVHVMFLIGFRSKVFVMMGWIYDYIFNNREARLITGDVKLRIKVPREAVRHRDDHPRSPEPASVPAGR